MTGRAQRATGAEVAIPTDDSGTASNLRTLLLTDSLQDYALAASVHRRLAATRQWAACYPIMEAKGRAPVVRSFLETHGIRPFDFSSICPKDSIEQRSEHLHRALFNPDAVPVYVSPAADFATLARALFASLARTRPLVFSDQHERQSERGLKRPIAGARGNHWVLARGKSPLAVAGAFYAAVAGKNYDVIDATASFIDEIRERNPASVILIDDFHAFNKAFLGQLSQLNSSTASGLCQSAILTAYSQHDFTALVFRMLAHREFRLAGMRLLEPAIDQEISFRAMDPLEYYVVAAHGNELHLLHSNHEVLCGAFPPERRRSRSLLFDCEPDCPYKTRVRANEIPIASLIILSCDSCTFGDGFVPPEFSVVLNLLNGWCTSVIASYKHAMVNPGFAILAEALVKSGYSLGEIVHQLNSIARLDSSPDCAFVLIGDPEFVPSLRTTRSPQRIKVTKNREGVDVECGSPDPWVLDLIVPAHQIADLLSSGSRLAVAPLSAEISANNAYFAFRRFPQSGELGVLVFGKGRFAGELHQFRITAIDAPTKREIVRLRRRLAAASTFYVYGIQQQKIAKLVQEASQLLNTLIAYPGCPDSILGYILAEQFGPICESVLGEIQVALLGLLRDLMKRQSLWISHKYAAFFPKVRRLEDPARNAPCPVCGNATAVWVYDSAFHVPGRSVRSCARCGIIADTPADSEIEIGLTSNAVATERHFEQSFTVTNLSANKLSLSLLAQFNEWKTQKVAVDPPVQTFSLDPGASRICSLKCSFRKALHDDILSMQVFAITENFLLHCFTQRMLFLPKASTRASS